ncbi:MAG: hypothetical protein M1816_001807 [Peltula sp. TS41687]|nr:MAG: hypothetical protein M1816_001807 [Peltula sp. TS41687]
MSRSDPASSSSLAINLSRLLSRLEKIILTSGHENDLLRRSSLERKRVGTNLDYARTLLFQLEQETVGRSIKAQQQQQQRKQSLQADLADLADKKTLVSRLNERLYQLNELDDEDLLALDGDDTAEGEEDLLGEEEEDHNVGDVYPNGDIAGRGGNIKDTVVPVDTTSLDRRKPFQSENDSGGGSSTRRGAATTDKSSSLFGKNSRASTDSKSIGVVVVGGATTTSSSSTNPNLSQTEKLLSHNRMEQEELTASLLGMAQALKASSQAFATSLESEKEILGRASEGLEKNAVGMEAAEKRMGALRRMTEGRGFLGRLLMYAWIMGLTMVALIIVAFLPKLRF